MPDFMRRNSPAIMSRGAESAALLKGRVDPQDETRGEAGVSPPPRRPPPRWTAMTLCWRPRVGQHRWRARGWRSAA